MTEVAILWVGKNYAYPSEQAWNITNWQQVNDKEYDLLYIYCNKIKKNKYSDYFPVLVIKESAAEIAETIEKCLILAKEEKAKAEDYDKKSAARKVATAKKAKERKLKQLEKLKKELGE